MNHHEICQHLIALSFGSYLRYLFRDAIIGPGTDFFGSKIFILPAHLNVLEAEFIPVIVKWTPVLLFLVQVLH